MKNALLLSSKGVLSVAMIGSILACATYRTLDPRIAAQPRSGLELGEPLLFAVLDGRTQLDDPLDDASEHLLQEVKRLYPNAAEPHQFFAPIPEGRVAVRVRIRELGASFGSRVVTASSVAASESSGTVLVSPTWGVLAAQVRERQQVLTSGIQAEGWWIGTAWLDVELVDRRGDGEQVSMTLVTEARQSNTFGYGSATDATEEAWRSTSADLLFVLDAVLGELASSVAIIG